MLAHHEAWLSAHPERSSEWFVDRMREGFHIHHIDGNHDNNDANNLVMIESGDHMLLHNGAKRLLWRPPSARKSAGGRPRKSAEVKSLKARLTDAERQLASVRRFYEREAKEESVRLNWRSAKDESLRALNEAMLVRGNC